MGPDGQARLNLGSASSSTFSLLGGKYGVTITATWGGGNVALQRVGPDGSTLVSVITALTANGYVVIDLPPGQYQFTVTTATAVYASVLHVPQSGN